MQIAVLGATGRTGQQVVQEALERGHDVKALVRNPDIFKLKDERIKVEKVNLFNEYELAQHLKDCDAVVSCIGTSVKFPVFRKMTFYYDSMKSIVGAMRQNKIRCLVCMSSWCTKPEPNGLKAVEWCFRPLMIGNYLKSVADMEDYLEMDCSDIEYTAVRPSCLVDEPSTGEKILASESQFIRELGSMSTITRRDVAKFMMDCIDNGEWKRKCVAIGIK